MFAQFPLRPDFALLHAGLIRSGDAYGLCDAVGAELQLVASTLLWSAGNQKPAEDGTLKKGCVAERCQRGLVLAQLLPAQRGGVFREC